MGTPSTSIRELATAVTAGTLQAIDVTEEALDRCERAQPALNAFTSLDHEGARAAARAVDAAVAAGENPGPLAGVPVAVKDLFDQAGLPNTRGSSAPPAIPVSTAPSVQRLEAAGAVVIGRTGLHEYAFGFSSENHWFGPVHNPWDLSLSPGGSSGGSGAAVSAGLVAATLGTDTGGSVRVPAALCGVVGLKVTHGRVPLRGVFPLAPSADTVGPLARSIGDCAAVYEVIAGDDPLDPWSVPAPVDPVGAPADLSKLTVGIPRPWVDIPVVDDQRAAFKRLLDDLSDAGARIIDLEIPELGPSHQSIPSLFFEVARIHRDRLIAAPEQYGPEVRERLQAALSVTGEEYLTALEWRRATLASALRAFDRVDVLATPTVASLRKTIGEETVQLGGEEVHYVVGKASFTTPVNHMGLPALAVPLPGGSAPPPSAQFIGRPWSETRLLEVGLALEEVGLIEAREPPFWQPGSVDPILE